MAIKKIKLPGMAQPVDIGTTWANVSGKPDLVTSDSLTAAINAAFATNDAMVFKGTIGAGGTITQLPATHEAGWTYKVITAGSLAGQPCEIGDMIVCIKDGTVADASDWTVIQTNVDGAITGPASSTAGHIATFTGTTGKVIQDSGFTIATSVPANAVFTDRYVNSASFADDTTNNTTSPVKMTLTRAGSDSATITSNIPKVSSSSAGVAPKGTAVSSQSQSTKFLREDGTWAAPSYTTITASGILKGNGNGGVSVATAGTDYATPAQVNAKYTKPSGGIPDSDIASASTWNAKAASTSVPASASVDASTGVMSFKNSSGTQLFTVTLPKYNGEVV